MSNKLLPSISIVVLNWNGKKFIDLFIPSALSQDYPKDKLEIVFTDNNSTDDSVGYFNNKYGKFKNTRVVKNANNFGYAKGNNLGIKTCKSDFILVCNNDLKLSNNLVGKLIDTAISKNADIVVPKLMFINKKGYINNAGSRIDENSNWPIYETGANEKDNGQYNKTREISAFCGACVLFKRSFLQEVGLYDNKFFMYFEDGDLSWRGQKANKKYFYEPKAVALHYHTGTSKEGSPLFNHFVGRNRILIITKNARLRIILSVWKVSLKDHLLNRLKNTYKAFKKEYPRKKSIYELFLSLKMLSSAALLTPYILLKRYHIIKEDHL